MKIRIKQSSKIFLNILRLSSLYSFTPPTEIIMQTRWAHICMLQNKISIHKSTTVNLSDNINILLRNEIKSDSKIDCKVAALTNLFIFKCNFPKKTVKAFQGLLHRMMKSNLF